MRDIIFYELRECSRTIGKTSDPTQREVGEKNILEIVAKMCELANTARKEGLYALEEEIPDIENIFHGKYLKYMIQLILDGTDPELMEELSITRYFSANLTGHEALHYLVMLVGCISMQTGVNPEVTAEKLWAMIPEEIAENHYKEQEEQGNDFDVVEQYYHGEIAVSPGDEYYIQIKAADCVIQSFDDGSLQRALRDVDNFDLALAMKALSGATRHHIFNNLSERLAVMVAEDMERMGSVEMKTIVSSTTKILGIIVKLINSNEVKCCDKEVLSLLVKAFDGTK